MAGCTPDPLRAAHTAQPWDEFARPSVDNGALPTIVEVSYGVPRDHTQQEREKRGARSPPLGGKIIFNPATWRHPTPALCKKLRAREIASNHIRENLEDSGKTRWAGVPNSGKREDQARGASKGQWTLCCGAGGHDDINSALLKHVVCNHCPFPTLGGVQAAPVCRIPNRRSTTHSVGLFPCVHGPGKAPLKVRSAAGWSTMVRHPRIHATRKAAEHEAETRQR